MTTRYGGDLQIGDFIMIANANYTSFGWFCGEGSGTVQYYHFCDPGNKFKLFQQWEAGKLPELSSWMADRFQKHGFSSKLLNKEYIYGGGIKLNGSRVVKITDPESIFTQLDDIEHYRKSKEALIHIKFPAK